MLFSFLIILKTSACHKPHPLGCGGTCFFDFDTSIWLDFFEKRGENGKEALELIKKIIENNNIIIFSDLHIKELKHLGYSFGEINDMLSLMRNNVRKVHIYREQKEIARKIAIQRNIPKGDVLHAILSRDNEAQLISRDLHFEELKDITIAKKPEEII